MSQVENKIYQKLLVVYGSAFQYRIEQIICLLGNQFGTKKNKNLNKLAC